MVDDLGRIEISTREDCLECRTDVVAVGKKEVCDLRDDLFAWIHCDKEGPELSANEAGALRLGHDCVNDIVSIKRPCLSKEGLCRRIKIPYPKDELPRLEIDSIPREGASCYLDVSFTVMPLTQRKELHHLTREVLIRVVLPTLP